MNSDDRRVVFSDTGRSGARVETRLRISFSVTRRPGTTVNSMADPGLITPPAGELAPGHLAGDPEGRVLVFIGGGGPANIEVADVIRIVAGGPSPSRTGGPGPSQRISEAHRQRPSTRFVSHTESGGSHPVLRAEQMGWTVTGDTLMVGTGGEAVAIPDVTGITVTAYRPDPRETS